MCFIEGGVFATEIRVEQIEAVEVEGRSRVQAAVEGEVIWFESSEVQLQPRPEAFGCALLIPALHKGARLVLTQPVDPFWLENLPPLLSVVATWWGYRQDLPTASIEPPKTRDMADRIALCFSGGVDSFFSLWRLSDWIDDLVTVFGFDIPLDDAVRIDSVEKSVREIAEQTGKRAIFIRTNLREHPSLGGVSWEITHGGAMAALGHLLSAEIRQLIISSSIPIVNDKPWGSHRRLDAHWSSSSTQIVNFGSEWRRLDKLREIASEPLVRRHLRVCWENRTPTGNCSVCAKCLRTRLLLADCGELHHYSGFEGADTLARDLRAVNRIDGRMQILQEVLAGNRLNDEILHEVRALIDRSHAPTPQSPESRPGRWSKIRAWISHRS